MTDSSVLIRVVRSRGFRVVAGITLLCLAGKAWNLHLNAAPQIAIPVPPPLPNPNAYDVFVRAAALRVEPPLEAWNPPRNGQGRHYTDAERQTMLARNRPALDAFRAPLRLPNYQLPPQRTLGAFNRNYAAFRSLARTLAFESWMREKRGDYHGAVDSALDGIQFGVTVPKGGNTISFLVGEAIEAISRRQVWGQIDHLNTAQAADAARRFEAIEAMRQPLSANVEEEKWTDLTRMRELFRRGSTMYAWREITGVGQAAANAVEKVMAPITGVVSEEHAMAPSEQREAFAENFRNWRELTTWSKQNILDDQARLLNEQVAETKQPYTAPRRNIAPPHDPFNRALYSGDSLIRWEMLHYADTQMENRLLTLALALRAYRLREGIYPESLVQLTQTGILKRVPDDPFAPKVGTPFPYRRQTGDRYLLYSIGPDGVDEGGLPVDARFSDGSRRTRLNADDKGDWVVGVNTAEASPQP